jgi:hypothetical protein
LLATLAGWLWMRFFCDQRRLRNAASDAGTNFFSFFFLPVHYPNLRSKSKERTSLSVVSLSSSSCEIYFGAFSLSCFFFRAFICGFDPNPVCLHLVSEIFRIYNRGLSVLPMRGASDD